MANPSNTIRGSAAIFVATLASCSFSSPAESLREGSDQLQGNGDQTPGAQVDSLDPGVYDSEVTGDNTACLPDCESFDIFESPRFEVDGMPYPGVYDSGLFFGDNTACLPDCESIDIFESPRFEVDRMPSLPKFREIPRAPIRLERFNK